jgi:hypothetical protein
MTHHPIPTMNHTKLLGIVNPLRSAKEHATERGCRGHTYIRYLKLRIYGIWTPDVRIWPTLLVSLGIAALNLKVCVFLYCQSCSSGECHRPASLNYHHYFSMLFCGKRAIAVIITATVMYIVWRTLRDVLCVMCVVTATVMYVVWRKLRDVLCMMCVVAATVINTKVAPSP